MLQEKEDHQVKAKHTWRTASSLVASLWSETDRQTWPTIGNRCINLLDVALDFELSTHESLVEALGIC